MSLVVWSALIPILPFLLSSLLLEGADHITQSLITIDMTTILSLLYLAFVATYTWLRHLGHVTGAL